MTRWFAAVLVTATGTCVWLNMTLLLLFPPDDHSPRTAWLVIAMIGLTVAIPGAFWVRRCEERIKAPDDHELTTSQID